MTPPPRILLAAGLITAGLVLGADPAGASYSVAVKQRTLVISGSNASDRLALRARPRKLEIDVRDNGTADFRVARRRFDRIRMSAGGGDDRVRVHEPKIAFTKRPDDAGGRPRPRHAARRPWRRAADRR